MDDTIKVPASQAPVVPSVDDDLDEVETTVNDVLLDRVEMMDAAAKSSKQASANLKAQLDDVDKKYGTAILPVQPVTPTMAQSVTPPVPLPETPVGQ